MTELGRLGSARRLLAKSRVVWVEHGVSPADQWREYRRFHDAIGMIPTECFGYDLWDTGRPMAERMRFISNRERRAIEYLMNPREANLELRHKGRASIVMTAAGIPVGDVLGLLTLRTDVHPPTPDYRWWHGTSGVRELLRAVPAEGIVIKPDDGGGGRSVHVFRAAGPDGLVALDHTAWSVDRLLTVLRTERLWKVERRVLPHPVLAGIAGETLGTLRFLTFRMLDGTVHLATTAWKIPEGLSGLDHFQHGAGAFAAAVDPATGAVGPGRKWHGLSHTDIHPTTGQRISGTIIPHWADACRVAIGVAECFPKLASLGLDIAIAREGPVVIEANPCWGERPNQVAALQGLVHGRFLEFLTERGFDSVMNLGARRDVA